MSRSKLILSTTLLGAFMVAGVVPATAVVSAVVDLLPGPRGGFGGCWESLGDIPGCVDEVLGRDNKCWVSSQGVLECLDKGLKAFQQPGFLCCKAFLHIYSKCWPKGLPNNPLLTSQVDYCNNKLQSSSRNT